MDGNTVLRALLELVAGGVASCGADDLHVEAIGIGAAGFILHHQGLLVESPNIAWSMLPLGDIVAERTVAEHGIASVVRDVEIVVSTVGNDAGMIGAAVMAWEGIGGQ
jgi:predicted NBD/HSP70 family sugar kinase